MAWAWLGAWEWVGVGAWAWAWAGRGGFVMNNSPMTSLLHSFPSLAHSNTIPVFVSTPLLASITISETTFLIYIILSYNIDVNYDILDGI